MRSVTATANLIVGKDGSTTVAGSSTPLSTDEDRRRFHQLRTDSDLILIGGNTARREPYKRTPIPLYILTHTKVRLAPKNQLAKQFKMTPKQMINEIGNNFPPQDSKAGIRLLVEAGPKLLRQMIDESLIDQIYLSINLEKTGDNQISIEALTSTFKLITTEVISACEFRYYQRLAN